MKHKKKTHHKDHKIECTNRMIMNKGNMQTTKLENMTKYILKTQDDV